jgi:hypothetical protein
MCSQSTASSSAPSYRSACAALLLAAVAAAPASAQAVLVDFEQLTNAPCNFVMTTPLHDELAALGIHFGGPAPADGGAVLDQCSNFVVNPHSGVKFLAFNSFGTGFPGGGHSIGPETVSFDQRVTSVDLWVASGTGQATFQIQALDGTALVGSNTISTGSFWTPLSMSVAAGFTRVVLTSNDSAYLYDDLSFTPIVSTLYCLGDGSGTACPCGNNSAVGGMAGCTSSLGIGARLDASGIASILSDTVVLTGTQMSNSSVLYYQGTTQTAGGSGTVFGDGLRCASGTVVRLKAALNAGGMSQYPGAGDAHVSVRGGVTSPGVRTYQAWYRNAAPFCTPSTFNLTNGVELTWMP